MNTEHLALVAGEGVLPIEILKSIRNAGLQLPKVYLLAENEAPYAAEGFSVSFIKNPLAIAMILAKMRLTGIRRLMMAGSVPKKNIYSKEKLDQAAQAILTDVRDRNDHSLLAGIVLWILI